MTPDVPWAKLAETHSAVVVFAGERAYKFKKPVTFDFLDFSTRELRERALRRELELNRRIAPDVYLGVADVLGDDGSVCDHLLVMRRLPGDRRLATLVEQGTVTDDDVQALVRVVATFHAGAARTSATAAAGAPEIIAAKLDRDLDELGRFAGSRFASADVDELTRRATSYVRGRTRLFETRVAQGWVCDGHGDLLADDVFCLADGPRILDCLDFSDDLRFCDVLADVAFLAMDLEHRGAPDLAERFIELYDEMSGERHPSSLLDYYIASRAIIRAKVAALRAEQGDEHAQDAAVRLLDLALAHLRTGRVALILVGGAPGTGKTTVAESLGLRGGWAVLRSDVVRKELAGVAAEQPMDAPPDTELYRPEMTRRTYAELLDRARIALELGQTLVLDATWTDASFRGDAGRVATAAASDLVELRCDTDPALATDRIARRRAAGHDASDADPAVAAALRTAADPWPAATVIDTSAAPEIAVERAWLATRVVPTR